MYNVGLTFTKFWFDKIELECAFITIKGNSGLRF